MDEERPAQLGCTQVLARRMSAFSNYAISHDHLGAVRLLTLYLFGVIIGGPAATAWGWVAVGR
ncbi:hypothetical protein GTY41_05400 [Streptomyces sp. SID685]|nr:hypothetical protein [Streptomyces sp. SID685]